MSIKKVKPDGKYNNSKYQPLNESKYIGQYPIVCRSSWERKYCIYCDNTEDIISWSSEPFEIKYYNPYTSKTHKYYPDFWIKVRKKDGTLQEYLIEIKPKKKLTKPSYPTKNSKKALENFHYRVKEYVQIVAKSRAAKEFAKSRNMKYIILTEDSIR